MRCIAQRRVPLTVSFTVVSRRQAHTADFPPSCRNRAVQYRDLAMISLDFDFNILTRDLSHYLENQVKVGLFGSGVGLSLVLGFSAAYTCYYLISVAKVRTSNSLDFVCPVIMHVRLQRKCALHDGLPGRRFCWCRIRLFCIFPPASGSADMCDCSPASQMNVMLGISADILALNQSVPQENCSYVNIDMDKTRPTLLYNGSKSR